jgi:rhodanese-related sulfurtransferase
MFADRVPEIDVQELDRRLKSEEPFILLDVREPWELLRARITDKRMLAAPMSRLSREGPNALPESARDPEAAIFVMCHHGVRSAQVTGWLAAQGWKKVFSVRGGIDAYASQVDPRVGAY